MYPCVLDVYVGIDSYVCVCVLDVYVGIDCYVCVCTRCVCRYRLLCMCVY